MKKRLFLLFCCFILCLTISWGQFTYGTTGMLHMPTADMQKDKTFMLGGGYMNKHATPNSWYYNTWNYYLNITIFPWLEVAYTCTLFSADHLKLDKWGYSGFTNQDRNFSVRLRVWKEGWYKNWTPQIVVGVNDFTTGGAEDYLNMAVDGNGNGYFNRYYISVSKHFDWCGKWGFHTAYMYNNRDKDKLNGLAFGVDYQFSFPAYSAWMKFINGLNLMGEYDSRYVNIGAHYAFWKDHINLVAELQQCKYPSIGLYFKIHLK